MGASFREARAYERAPIRERAVVVVEGTTHHGWISRVGGGGVFFETRLPLDRGDELLVRFRLACFEEPLLVKGEVRWVSEAGPHHPAGIGIAFIDLKAETRQQIVEFVADRGNVLFTVGAMLERGAEDMTRLRHLLQKVDLDSVTSLDDLRAKVRDGMGGFFDR